MSKILLEDFNDHFCDDFSEDIYFQKEYVKLYGEVFEFIYKEDKNFLKVIANKKSIQDTPFFDLQSPYGYGGIYSNSDDHAFLNRALKNLKQRALQENIIAFFIRFHPFDKNLNFYQTKLDFFKKERKIVIVPIYKDLEQIRANYSPRIRSYIKKARKELEISIVSVNDAKDFKRIYDDTMTKNQANEFYFFSNDYFKNLFNFKQNLVLKASYNDEILAYASFFLDKKFAYYHLSANKNEKNANAALLDYFFEICSSKGIDFVLLGGGVKDDDSLFYFKQKFSTLEGFFYIGGVIFDELNYNELSKAYKNNFFLKYRDMGGVEVIFMIFKWSKNEIL
ncbi:hypothetical protein [Campylobacter insulaenigrae]|uniref:hypothetical protein n=1 Tax=Campylobacter insulaenigrae TaxID=260714 RepID=UPI0021530753|nr:hypothetical protein [Campylobacter insulaenigrae]MCR6570680.1 hypothetical protein [Campylobacter insulaenigrae]MCR6572391.1 hypothetical protein [Campylobacter insulaenigrae]MCR6579290.1 hypothetical protein [Campylobacter insulaenigrae]MCR6583491.1 hypothetical protein [Campylobacter insulaenigrae]MCR6585983.1 hypothetical protein [Campylobacter insulaenigrae]